MGTEKRETHVPKLICHTRERRPEPRRAHLGKLDGNNTPCSLYTELDTERASGEAGEAAWDDPERNKGADEEGEADDGQSATEVLRKVSCDCTTTTNGMMQLVDGME